MSAITVVHRSLREIVRPNVLPNILNIGLTGNMGSGKSTLAQILKEQGAAVIDMDQISRQITAKNGSAILPIRKAFGDEMIDADGALNRTRMRELVFQNQLAKAQLEGITHQIIGAEAIRQAHEAAALKPIGIVYDIPLLVDNQRWLDVLDVIIVVMCDRETQIARVLRRNPDYNRELIESILNCQANSQKLFEIGDIIIDNSGDGTNHLQAYTQINILLGYINDLSLLKSNLKNQ